MGFSAKQLQSLRRNLNRAYIRTKKRNGRELSYVEAWYAIAEANRIFGFDGWDRETIETRCVQGREVRGTFHAVYVAKVRISVHANGQVVVREGHGSGEGHGSSLGETHDIALKAAETDATRRALATFGKPFGLALYLGAGLKPTSETQQLPPIPDPVNAAIGEAAVRRTEIADANIQAGPAAEFPLAPIQEDPHCGPGLLRPLATHPGVHEAIFPRRIRDRAHLKFVTNQPCLMCGRRPSDAHHLRFAQPRALGVKVSDEFTVPLCRLHHREIHHCGNEAAFWSDLEIDALAIARGLWAETLEKRHLRANGQKPA